MATFSAAEDKNAEYLEQKLRRSLVPAIFIPFKGFNFNSKPELLSSTAAPTEVTFLDPALKLERILEYLPQQQDVVLRQMITVILQQIDELKEKARRELEQVKIERGPNFCKEEREREKFEKMEIEEMFRYMRAPCKQDKSYELQLDDKFIENMRRLPQELKQNIDDIESNYNCSDKRTERTLKQIKDKLIYDMQILVKYGLRELEKYEKHCHSVIQPYDSSMARRTASSQVNRASTTKPTINPNLNSNSQNMNSIFEIRTGVSHDIGRLSNGMPVSMERHSARKMESLEELMRRK